MIEYGALYLTNLLILNEKISEEQKEIYNYGFELLISSLINFIIIIVLSLIFDEFYFTMYFIIQYYPLKKISGGYHANTYRKCILSFTLIYTSILIINTVQKIKLNNILILGWITGFLLLFIFAPIEDKRKPIDKVMRKKLKRSSILLYFVYSILNIIVGCISKYNISEYEIFGVLALNLITVLMIAGIINNHFMEHCKKYVKNSNYQ